MSNVRYRVVKHTEPLEEVLAVICGRPAADWYAIGVEVDGHLLSEPLPAIAETPLELTAVLLDMLEAAQRELEKTARENKRAD